MNRAFVTTKSLLAYINDSWTTEVFFMAISLCCCIAITAILISFDQNPAPVLRYGLTLNAVIAILATASKSSLSLVVASCIGQRKWLWYRDRAQKLNDLQTFDDASRGPLGAMWLLFGRTVYSSTSLGALIVLLLLAFDPFLQQVLTYPVRPVHAFMQNDTTAQAQRSFGSPFLFRDTNVLQLAVQAAVWTDPPGLQPRCPSANCTWPTFTSLEWCGTCDANQSTSLLVEPCNLYPRNFSDLALVKVGLLNSVDPTLNLTCDIQSTPGLFKTKVYGGATCDSYDGIKNDSRCSNYTTDLPYELIYTSYDVISQTSMEYLFSGVENSTILGDVSLLGIKNPFTAVTGLWFDHEAGATRISRSQTCVLDLCYREKNVTVRNGMSDIKIERERSSVKAMKTLPGSDANNRLLCWLPSVNVSLSDLEVVHGDAIPDITYYVDIEKLIFCVDIMSSSPGVSNTLSFPIGLWSKYQSYTCADSEITNCQYVRDAWDFAPEGTDKQFHGDTAFQQVTSIGLDTIIGKIATSISNLALVSPASDLVPGMASSLVTYVQVRWLWLLFPFSLNVSGFVFLVLTMRATRSRRAPLWKSSAIALLYHGLEDRSDLEDILTLSEMEQASTSSTVQLQASGMKEGLMLRNSRHEQDSTGDSSALLETTVVTLNDHSSTAGTTT